ncbi:MAG: ATP-binding cassette domain-containing protein, partial [Paracoccaceae bacterium]|nr:ATP-binding cassette domain-containing protein [Paracoccaceae bacterium]
MSDTAIEFVNVVKRYGSALAVDGISFSIAKGELVTFLGPSGCGKTTSLRLIAGLELPSEGQVLIGGRDVSRDPASDRNVG